MVNTSDDDRHVPVRVPHVEVADKIVFGLTARQLAYAVATVAVGFAAWQVITPAFGPAPALVVCAVLGLAGAVLVFVRRDGAGIDRLLLAALRRPRRPLVPTGDGRVPRAAHGWAATRKTRQVRHPSLLRTPVAGIAADGTVDLGSSGLAAVLAVTTGLVNFNLLAPGEQRMLTARLARVLSALTGPVQILTVTTAATHGPQVDAIINAAPGLPARMSAAADAHAAYLEDLAAHQSPTGRHVLIIVPAATPQALTRRLGEVGNALTGCGLTSRRVDGFDVADLIATLCDPCPFDTMPEELS